MTAPFDAFIFDIHDVLLRNGTRALFRKFLERQAQEDPRIDLSFDGDVPAVMNGLLYKYCPLCAFMPCKKEPIGSPHLKKMLYTGQISFEQMKVAMTQMLTHFVECSPKVRIILDYLAEFSTVPALIAREVAPIPEGVALLRRCLDKHGPQSVFILSNATTPLYSVYEQRFPEIFSGLRREQVILSSEIGMAKPDPAVYRHVLERFALRPARAIFFDDSISNVQIAREVGMHAVLVDPMNPQRMQKEFESLGL